VNAPSANDSPSTHALLTLLRAADIVWNASRLFFERWRISPSQFNILNLLWLQTEGMSQSELGRQLIMHRSNVTGLIDRLEKRGLVARQDVELDRRAYRVVLTQEGATLVKRILPDYHAAAALLWQVVPERRLAGLTSDLKAIAEKASQIASDLDKTPVSERERFFSGA
jgi:DNA-binding MarR family transcriptional regulator